MLIYKNRIPASHYSIKSAQIVPEQSLNSSVSVYVESIPYIKCQIKSTIQHEAGHRQDESKRYDDLINGVRVPSFSEFSAENRAEPIAEKEEENCESFYPSELSGATEVINLFEIFEEAKSGAKIDPNFRNDIKAGNLKPDAQGMYLMQDLPKENIVQKTNNPHLYRGFDGTLWVDVRKIVTPFMSGESRPINPPTFQTDGVDPDVPNISQKPPTSNSLSAVPSIPSVPSVGAR